MQACAAASLVACPAEQPGCSRAAGRSLANALPRAELCCAVLLERGARLHQGAHEEGVVCADAHVAGVGGRLARIEVIAAACDQRVPHPAQRD